ncbi:MAG: prephenate dehydratase [Opitutaceae bacterium]|nr:prephenate dehydratase [Opitutaceae bacterium]
MDIDLCRQQIDGLDRQIVEALNRRLSLAAEIGKLKRQQGGPIYVAERQEQVFRKVCEQNRGPLNEPALRAIYREIMSAAIALEQPLKIAYLGPDATNSHQASMRQFGASVDYLGLPTFADIFAAVNKGEADYGVIPVENSTEGSVRDALDLFVETELKIVAQSYLEIAYCLISAEPMERITKVYSKDQALGQCRLWLQRHLPHAQLLDAPSTARAVQIAKGEVGAAAVANELAATFHQVPILARDIEDVRGNTTRFFVIGKQPSGCSGPGGQDVSTFLISLGDEATHSGSLLRMLMPFSERGLSLTKIESRPTKKRAWDYYFFIDVAGHYDDPRMREAVLELKKFCPLVKWLGSYPVVTP